MSTAARAEVSGEVWKGQDPFSDLQGLLTEMQALRVQLEKSIETNNTLRSKLEEQLMQGAKQTQEGALSPAVQTLSAPKWSLQLDKHGGNPASLHLVKVQLCVSVCSI
jgi:CDK5 regulatory subunit-associated protein 2